MQGLKISPSLGLIMDLFFVPRQKKCRLKTKPFRCEEFWFHILGFIDVVRDSWNTTFTGSNAFQLVKKIQVLRQKVRDWNRQDVGNLEENIKQLEKEIDMVQGLLMTDPHNVSLHKKNVDLSQNLNQVLNVTPVPRESTVHYTLGVYKSTKCHVVVFWRLKWEMINLWNPESYKT